MIRPQWCAMVDLSIVREDGVSKLYDCDGVKLGTLPGDWTDTMIQVAVALANKAFDAGIDTGQWMRAAEIRRALGMEV